MPVRCTLAQAPLLVLAMLAAGCLSGAHESELVLAERLQLGDRGLDVKPAIGFRASHVKSELILELPRPTRVGGFLTSTSGERITLDSIEPVERDGRHFVRLSSNSLQSNAKGQLFATATLWADETITTGRLVWHSYDPGGAEWPDALK